MPLHKHNGNKPKPNNNILQWLYECRLSKLVGEKGNRMEKVALTKTIKATYAVWEVFIISVLMESVNAE